MQKDPLSASVIGAAIEVHRHLGPGLRESTYEACLAHELQQRGIEIQRQVTLPVRYKGVSLECGYRIDIMVEDRLLLELKAVDRVLPIHTAQILTYMRLASVNTGLLINFNVTRLADGVQRFKL
ncbi:GxxExxY protein [Thiococcus pfennigii]|uniref:GxxExxY protein n=1 Tax=Thiococcus pfennigii TaxID=1057 RepID=UPI001906DE12|nr:GxxExxY protein [Thiococcus pfennigii]